MSRIVPNRIGYSMYVCIGIDPYIIGPIDCSSSGYKRVPPFLKGSVSNYAWEDLSAVTNAPEREAKGALCNVDYDPFTGSFTDLHNIFESYAPSYIENLCYETTDSYTAGYRHSLSSLTMNDDGSGGADPCCGQ